MSAPKPLPPCPVCGAEPAESMLGSPGYAANYAIECRRYQCHLLQVAGRTRRIAMNKWRRIAGGAK